MTEKKNIINSDYLKNYSAGIIYNKQKVVLDKKCDFRMIISITDKEYRNLTIFSNKDSNNYYVQIFCKNY